MRLTTLFSTALIALGLLASSPAQAQNIGDLSLRLEPGVAISVGSPQTDRFDPGFSGAAKVGVSLCPWFDFGPAVSELVLPSNVNGVDAGTATFLGGFARVKRSHSNTDTGIMAASPWIEGDLSYVRTGPLDRFGWAVQAGVAWPTSETARNIWIGPFVEAESVFQPKLVGFDSTDDKTFIVGLSVEFGPKASKPAPATVCPECKPAVVQPVPEALPKEKRVEFVEVIQFAVNSHALDNTATKQLNDVVGQLKAATSYDHIEVEGHASSDGPAENNNELALDRAKSVRAFLIASGLPKDKVSASGFGSASPVESNKTLPGRVRNRRASFTVRFVIVSKESK